MGIIPDDEKELYLYGFFILFSNFFYSLISIIIGIVFGNVVASILLYALFAFVRSYSGGFHASKESHCILITIGSLILSNSGVLFLSSHGGCLSKLILIFSGTTVFFLSPLESSEKPLSKEEQKHCKNSARIIVILYMLMACIAVAHNYYMFASVISMSLSLECFVLWVGKYQRSQCVVK